MAFAIILILRSRPELGEGRRLEGRWIPIRATPSCLQIAEAGLALDGVGRERGVEGGGGRLAGLALAADLAEEGLEPVRHHRPGHLEVARTGVDDLVLEPRGRDHGGPRDEGMRRAVDLDRAGALVAEEQLDLAVVAVLGDEAAGRD